MKDRLIHMDDAHKSLARHLGMGVVASAHVLLAVLGITNKLEFTQRSTFPVLETAASTELWVPIHLVIGIGLIFATLKHKWERCALSASAGFMGTWSVFNLLWGLSTIREVSLAGPTLGLCVAASAYVLSITTRYDYTLGRE